jgi:hypothetical protein
MNVEVVESPRAQRYKSEDIKHSGRLTDDQIADIPIKYVYEWVKTSKWKAKDFRKWLTVMRVIE